jgi:hypothetical protein
VQKRSASESAADCRRHGSQETREQAAVAAQRLPKKEGTHNHHWSYRKEHYKDIINVDIPTHNKIHVITIYDQERQLYRTISGILLDSRESYILYLTQNGIPGT